jgi:hypothetical protein
MKNIILLTIIFLLGFISAVVGENYLPNTRFQLGCYQENTRMFRTDAWIHRNKDPEHIYYPVGWGSTVLHSYEMWFAKAKHVQCDKMIDGNKQ